MGKGCKNGDKCPFNHPTREEASICYHFQKGSCTNPNCKYHHPREMNAKLNAGNIKKQEEAKKNELEEQKKAD